MIKILNFRSINPEDEERIFHIDLSKHHDPTLTEVSEELYEDSSSSSI